jgi:hypothetical protein
MSADKREAERVPILGGLQGEIMIFQPILVKEISRTGASIETHFRLPLNSLHDVRLTLHPKSVVVKGRVVHSHISDVDQDIVSYRTGIEFIEPSGHVVDAIDEFLEGLKMDRPQS